jgi:hypothetical protein
MVVPLAFIKRTYCPFINNMQKISPALKGLLTALVMITVTLLIDHYRDDLDPRIQYSVFILYAFGVLWTLIDARKVVSGIGALFAYGFRCFIVVTLLMISFTYIYIRFHPELAQQEAAGVREYYQGKDKTPPQIEELAETAKKQYPVAVISISIFRYLIIGAVSSLGLAVILNRRT